MSKENTNPQMDRLVAEIKALPEPDYEKHFDRFTQERIHQHLMDMTRKQKKRKTLTNKLQPIFLSIAGILVLMVIISNVLPLDHLTRNNADNHETYQFSGNVYNLQHLVVIKGLSNLPEGTVITVEKAGKEKDAFLYEDSVEVDDEGSFQFFIERAKKDEEYLMNVIIYSHLQPQRVKQVLGERGQELKQIKNAKGAFEYRYNGNDYYGLKLMGAAYRVDTTEYHLLPKYLRDIKE
ncbi:hypothetical protein LCM10_04165 [Rossellomorea aquimaris]|uniref:hypothetical protein n=1 Tax=Rossellomorea aquimaris TaxID=189382 RepID=UPI001CD266C1|nr:hypothetical protein [Rossellomorea aquimaris]MCA1054171.1 hypothetical protein [Rossellomorea aquimaris]